MTNRLRYIYINLQIINNENNDWKEFCTDRYKIWTVGFIFHDVQVCILRILSFLKKKDYTALNA